MKYVLSVLADKEAEINEELRRLDALEGHPNEKLRQISLKSNYGRLKEIADVRMMILDNINL